MNVNQVISNEVPTCTTVCFQERVLRMKWLCVMNTDIVYISIPSEGEWQSIWPAGTAEVEKVEDGEQFHSSVTLRHFIKNRPSPTIPPNSITGLMKCSSCLGIVSLHHYHATAACFSCQVQPAAAGTLKIPLIQLLYQQWGAQPRATSAGKIHWWKQSVLQAPRGGVLWTFFITLIWIHGNRTGENQAWEESCPLKLGMSWKGIEDRARSCGLSSRVTEAQQGYSLWAPCC